MRLVACSTAFFTTSFALTFSSPTSNSAIDPTQPIVISWSISYTDPSVIDLKLSNSDNDITLATGVVTYTGTYTIPGGTLPSSGSGYTLVAEGNGDKLAQVTGLSLGGSDTSDQTSTNAEVTLVSTQTVVPTPASGNDVPTASIDSVGVTTMSGIISGSQASITTTLSGLVTSTTSRTGSGSTVSSTAGSTNTNTASGGQRRRLPGELVLGVAGLLAGIVALLA